MRANNRQDSIGPVGRPAFLRLCRSLPVGGRRQGPFRLQWPLALNLCYNYSMAIDPRQIQLSDQQQKQLAETAEKTGRPWGEILDDALRSIPVRDEAAGIRLRRILDDLGRNAVGVADGELDAAIDEASQHVRHGHS